MLTIQAPHLGEVQGPTLDGEQGRELLKPLKNALLDIEGSKDYLSGSGKVNRNWVHNLLGVEDSELRERALRGQYNKEDHGALRQKFKNFSDFEAALGNQGTDAIKAGNIALTDEKGAIRQLTMLGEGDKAKGVNVFNSSAVDALQTPLTEAQTNAQITKDAAVIRAKQELAKTDPNFLYKQQRDAKADALALAQANTALAMHKDKIKQANLDRDWKTKESQREWEYRRRRDREDNLDDLFKVIMGGINAFI